MREKLLLHVSELNLVDISCVLHSVIAVLCNYVLHKMC